MPLGFGRIKRAFQRNDSVESKLLCRRILRIYIEVAMTEKLELIAACCFFHIRLNEALQHLKRIRINAFKERLAFLFSLTRNERLE